MKGSSSSNSRINADTSTVSKGPLLMLAWKDQMIMKRHAEILINMLMDNVNLFKPLVRLVSLKCLKSKYSSSLPMMTQAIKHMGIMTHWMIELELYWDSALVRLIVISICHESNKFDKHWTKYLEDELEWKSFFMTVTKRYGIPI